MSDKTHLPEGPGNHRCPRCDWVFFSSTMDLVLNDVRRDLHQLVVQVGITAARADFEGRTVCLEELRDIQAGLIDARRKLAR